MNRGGRRPSVIAQWVILMMMMTACSTDTKLERSVNEVDITLTIKSRNRRFSAEQLNDIFSTTVSNIVNKLE